MTNPILDDTTELANLIGTLNEGSKQDKEQLRLSGIIDEISEQSQRSPSETKDKLQLDLANFIGNKHQVKH